MRCCCPGARLPWACTLPSTASANGSSAFVSSSVTKALQSSPYLHHRILVRLEEIASVKINQNKASAEARSRIRSRPEQAGAALRLGRGWKAGG